MIKKLIFGIGAIQLLITTSFAQLPAQMMFNENANRLPVTSGLSLWFDAADAGSIVRDASNKISIWQDKSGNNNHAQQSIVANQPIYTTNSLNALPVVYFNSTAASMTGTTNGNYQTIIAVRNVASTASGYQTLFAANANTDYSIRLNGGYTGTVQNTAYNGDNNSQDWAGNNTNVKYVNGTNTAQIPTPNYHIIVTNSPVLISNRSFSLSTSFSNRGMIGGIAELLAYNRILTSAERQSLEQYLARKWRITISPVLVNP